MKYSLILIFSFFSVYAFAQERLRARDVYEKKQRFYKVENDSLFSGVTEVIHKNGHISFEYYYMDGFLKKYIQYYKIKTEHVVSLEGLIGENGILETYFSIDGKTKWITHFDRDGEKFLYEIYEDGKLIYSCEYKNRKKHGKEFCITKKCASMTDYYVDGKRVK